MRILYRHSKPVPGMRRMTVAGHYDEANSMMHFAVSVCRPGENFCKKSGRDFADRRVANGEISHSQSIPPELQPRLGRFFVETADLLINAKETECTLRELIFLNRRKFEKEFKENELKIKNYDKETAILKERTGAL